LRDCLGLVLGPLRRSCGGGSGPHASSQSRRRPRPLHLGARPTSSDEPRTAAR
jgi:hypothetical protein